MCIVSNIGDDWRNKWPIHPNNPYKDKGYDWDSIQIEVLPPVSRKEFDALKKEVEELKKLLQAAKAYDEATGQPHCEMDDKVALIKKIAQIVGVDLEDVFGETSR